MSKSNKEYLGDGAYVQFDGFGFTVTTEDGISVQNEIYFEPEVVNAFFRYVKRQNEVEENAE